jgi:DNA-directed RNA polymerase subunit F
MPTERYITLAEVKEILEAEAKLRDLTNDQKIALDNATKVAKISGDDARKLVKELKDLEFISDPVAVKIADLLPTQPEDVRVLFAKERLILEKKQVDALLAVVQKYL